jgi:hypothetical protein
MAEEVFDGIQRCIDDAALYIPPNEFFNLLQDEGVDVTDKQARGSKGTCLRRQGQKQQSTCNSNIK